MGKKRDYVFAIDSHICGIKEVIKDIDFFFVI